MSPITLFSIGVIQALLLLLAAPLFSGFMRVLRAKIQTRKGPPLMQNYRDIFKLMKRQEIVSNQAGWIFRAMPYLLMAGMLLAAMIIPILTLESPLGMAGDLILLIYLFALPRFFFILSGLESGSPFGGLGSRRETLLSVLVEPVLLLVVFVMALEAGSTNIGTITTQMADGSRHFTMAVTLSMLAFVFATYVEMGRLPFDLSEAEQELQEGPLAEYSGPSLAILKWGLALKQVVLVLLFVALFLPFGMMSTLSPLGLVVAVVVALLKATVFFAIVALIENVMARMRFVRAPAVSWLALGAALLSFVFYLADV